jgi:hypothetical protein
MILWFYPLLHSIPKYVRKSFGRNGVSKNRLLVIKLCEPILCTTIVCRVRTYIHTFDMHGQIRHCFHQTQNVHNTWSYIFTALIVQIFARFLKESESSPSQSLGSLCGFCFVWRTRNRTQSPSWYAINRVSGFGQYIQKKIWSTSKQQLLALAPIYLYL